VVIKAIPARTATPHGAHATTSLASVAPADAPVTNGDAFPPRVAWVTLEPLWCML
jgi:hypothetical protein